MSNSFWKPDRETSRAIRRGETKFKDWLAERAAEFDRERLIRETEETANEHG